MKRKWLVTMITAVLFLTAGLVVRVYGETRDSNGSTELAATVSEAEIKGFEEFSYDSDDEKFMAMCNAILHSYPEMYNNDSFDAAIPVPYVVYEQDLGGNKTGAWGTFASCNFKYDPKNLLMEMVGCSFDRGLMIIEEKNGHYTAEWKPAYTDDDQAALEKEYHVTDQMEQFKYTNEDVDKKMAEILKGYCEYNGYRIIGYKYPDGTVHKYED